MWRYIFTFSLFCSLCLCAEESDNKAEVGANRNGKIFYVSTTTSSSTFTTASLCFVPAKFTFLPTGLLSKIELLFFFLFLQASNATVPVAGTKHKDAVVKVEDDVVVET